MLKNSKFERNTFVFNNNTVYFKLVTWKIKYLFIVTQVFVYLEIQLTSRVSNERLFREIAKERWISFYEIYRKWIVLKLFYYILIPLVYAFDYLIMRQWKIIIYKKKYTIKFINNKSSIKFKLRVSCKEILLFANITIAL